MMDPFSEFLIVGWDNIARFLATSKRTAQTRRAEMIEDNVLFKRQKGKTRVVFTYPSLLKIWLMKKNEKGQRI